MNKRRRNGLGLLSGGLIGTLGGLIGLGGAEFRLPVLVGVFKLPTLEAVILNKATSLVVVAAALLFRGKAIALDALLEHLDVVFNLLAGSLVGAWWAAGHAMTMPRQWLNRIVMVMLVALALLMLWEALAATHGTGVPLIEAGLWRYVAGVVAGLVIGIFAALLGVAGGELLIPTIVVLYGADVKLAGSLSLMVSLPTMIVGFARYTQADAFAVLREEQSLMGWMVAGSILGAAVGAMLLGLIPTQWLLGMLGLILLISAIKTFQHAH